MSYLVLARKWRPQTFSDLVGQEHVSQTLGNAIQSDRVHHAFLFTGARGVGKTSAARILAKALNCEEGMTTEPCGQCRSCVEIAGGNGVDVQEIDGASNTGVDAVRELRDNIRYLPSVSRFKIFIIDEVHMLSVNAFNALLKTLEEPPEHAKFVFATTEPHKIPLTILSRCQRFDFRKIALPLVTRRLREIVDAEQVSISDRGLALVARKGEGSMRDSLSTLDQVLAFCGDKVGDDDLLSLLGVIDRRLILATLGALRERDSRQLLDIVRRVDEQGYSLRQYCQELVELFRSLIICQVVEDPAEQLEFGVEEIDEMKDLSSRFASEELHRLITVLLKAETEVAVSTQPRLVVEMTLVRLAQFPAARPIGEMLQSLERLEKRIGSGGGAPPSSGDAEPRGFTPPPPTAPTPVDPPDEGKKKTAEPAPLASGSLNWPALVQYVRSEGRPRIASFLEQANLLEAPLPKLVLGLPKGSFVFSQLEDAETREIFELLAARFCGRETIKLELREVDGKQPLPPSLIEKKDKEESDRKRRLREDALNHPTVKTAQDLFGGKVVEVKAIDKGFV
ncbi:MAG: DNA polymerase III subunit gamma/tau [Desulfuromonas sp.]|nr:MAG: DNA polymerase III subunit gamma/tau [Desulfuromonas sp.]